MTTVTEPATEAGTYTVDQMAGLLDCGRKAVYHRVRKGYIPAWVIVRFGRKLAFRRDAVARWLAGETR